MNESSAKFLFHISTSEYECVLESLDSGKRMEKKYREVFDAMQIKTCMQL